ncbi:MAG: LPXTG cell wall anchor domain-containing protein, partial [Solobacterium sp.]|nr:LPXTG cell wall anchor domain-containing protein [Solobacterium sp.]
GYVLLDSPIRITIAGNRVTAMLGTSYLKISVKGDAEWVEGQADDTYQISVWNNPGVVLPNTGGSGTAMIYLIGMMLIGLASVGLIMKNRREAA